MRAARKGHPGRLGKPSKGPTIPNTLVTASGGRRIVQSLRAFRRARSRGAVIVAKVAFVDKIVL